MANTSTLSVNDAGDPEAVTVTIACDTVQVWENAQASGWPRGFEVIEGPSNAETPVDYAQGGAHTFHKPGGYNVGDIAGWLQLLAGGGTTTFNIREYFKNARA